MALVPTKKLISIAQLVLFAFRKYKLQFAGLIGLGFLGGLSEAVGISAAIPLFYLMTGQDLPSANIITDFITTAFNVLHIPVTPPFLLGFIITLFIFKAVVQFAVRYMNALTVARFEEQTRNDLLSKTLQATWPYLLNKKAGHLEAVMIMDVERGAMVFNQVSAVAIFLTGFITYALAALSISTPITLLSIGIGGAMFFLLKPVFYRSRKLIEEAATSTRDIHHYLSESFFGIKAIKAAAREHPVLDTGRQYFRNLRNARVKTSFYRQSALALIEPVSFIFISILFALSYTAPTFSIASFVVIMYLIQKMFSFLQSTQSNLHAINEFTPHLKSILRYRKEIVTQREQNTGTTPFSFQKELTFDNVDFAYNETKKILVNASFSVPRGSFTAIVGPSGIGKTTIGDILLRLLTPQAGRVTIDGHDISTIDMHEWRKHIGYVPQDPFLLNDTIENNIRFFDNEVTQEQIIQAAKRAHIYDTVMELPEQFATRVGDRGLKLSGGQRQRIVLARALAREPSILILDEATSAVDHESEELIQKALQNLRGKTTVIAITHRIASILSFDQIIALDHGKVVEAGNPQDLLGQKDSYVARLSSIQL
ncbi:MAG: ABC transporter ATP-binding protein [Candidatus Paceibacterota bacterium]|nr:MAG: ABC transporter ATP-binding protein [Candidatus Paceibacterota bacterium]